MVTVALVYKEGLDQRRGGHRVTFDLGAGKRPGIVTRKSQGIQLCGFSGRARGVSSDKPCDSDGAEDCILDVRSEEHTSELQSQSNLVCRLLLEKKKNIQIASSYSQSPKTLVQI